MRRPHKATPTCGQPAHLHTSSLTSKAYGGLTHHHIEVGRLPEDVRDLLPGSQADKKRIYVNAVPPKAQEILWNIHTEALQPLAEQGKFGCALFQFPPWF